jgi:radical SAM superfamily enzyme YgiQ (UPF0313 family)
MSTNKIKFLLINPTSEYWRKDNRAKPKAHTRVFRFSMHTSLSVAASAPDYVETQILDEDVEDIDFNTDADVIGISFMTFNAPRAYEIADRFRQEKNKTVIFGGFHPSFMPEEATPHCDAICVGEAENKLPRIFDDFVKGDLKKIYDNSNCANLTRMPHVNRKLLKKSYYAPCDTIQATRGCENECKFCSITSFFRHKHRKRPVDDVINELKELGRYILFVDDNITADADYAEELFEKMIPLKKRWISQCSLTITENPRLLELAARSGCIGYFVGLESIEKGNLDKWEKGINKSHDYKADIDKLHSFGIGVCAGIVLGDDSDTKETFKKTLRFLYDARVDALQATILTPFPGTPLFNEMENDKRIVDYDWEKYDFSHVVFEPKQMSRETLKAGHDWILSHFYSKEAITRRLIRQFNYLDWSIILRVTLPINLNYRSRLIINRTIEAEPSKM